LQRHGNEWYLPILSRGSLICPWSFN
jgi:hypothetical protein